MASTVSIFPFAILFVTRYVPLRRDEDKGDPAYDQSATGIGKPVATHLYAEYWLRESFAERWRVNQAGYDSFENLLNKSKFRKLS